jgi:hypothetical protein
MECALWGALLFIIINPPLINPPHTTKRGPRESSLGPLFIRSFHRSPLLLVSCNIDRFVLLSHLLLDLRMGDD